MSSKKPRPPRLRTATCGALFLLTLLVAVVALAAQLETANHAAGSERFRNAYTVAGDSGERLGGSYFLRRAWVQITRDLSSTEVPPTLPLDLQAMAQRPFAVSWLGHASMLLRVGSKWVLVDPVFSGTAGPVQGFGPARLTPLPFDPAQLPHIDLVLISHDHYDHLDLGTMRQLAAQPGGAPRFFVGKGLRPWFAENIGARADEFDWWQTRQLDELTLRFVPAQHNSGRDPWSRNRTLWGGWVIEHGMQRFYFAGDTAYVAELFRDLRARVGAIDLAAIPIGAYRPREFMRFEHLDPDDAVLAHQDLGATLSFGVHWGTFQLGDEEPFDAARDLYLSLRTRGVDNFGVLAVGAVVDVPGGIAAVPAPRLADVARARAADALALAPRR
jgi:L-ascorbate metabolism protein UlaG (beta-lactamase superfamily)